jgi:hypothetical protein
MAGEISLCVSGLLDCPLIGGLHTPDGAAARRDRHLWYMRPDK